MLHLTVVQGLWLILPAYLANMGATLVGGGPPVDGGRNWSDGRRILGDGKSWRGLVLAPLLAAGLTGLLHLIAQRVPWGLTDFGATPWWFVHAYALGLGALLGDIAASFLKRRLGKERGTRWLGPDQLDFIVGAFVLAFLFSLATAAATGDNWFLDTVTWQLVVVVVVLTPGLHLIVNWIGWKIGVKEVPW